MNISKTNDTNTIVNIIPKINVNINDIIALIFTIILIIIYIPQLWKIYRTKSNVGINMWYMFLGHSASLLTTINSLIFYIDGWKVCNGIIGCVETFIGYGIIVNQWLLFLIMYILFIIYIHRPDEIGIFGIKRGILIKFTFGLSMILGIIILSITLILLNMNKWEYGEKKDLTIWSSFVEIIILVFFLIHYMPQIYECYRIKSAGSISLITLAIMTPGSIIFTIYLALQGSYFTTNKDTSNPMVWIPYLIVGIMQAILLGMGIYYERKKRLLNALKLETQQFFDESNNQNNESDSSAEYISEQYRNNYNHNRTNSY